MNEHTAHEAVALWMRELLCEQAYRNRNNAALAEDREHINRSLRLRGISARDALMSMRALELGSEILAWDGTRLKETAAAGVRWIEALHDARARGEVEPEQKPEPAAQKRERRVLPSDRVLKNKGGPHDPGPRLSDRMSREQRELYERAELVRVTPSGALAFVMPGGGVDFSHEMPRWTDADRRAEEDALETISRLGTDAAVSELRRASELEAKLERAVEVQGELAERIEERAFRMRIARPEPGPSGEGTPLERAAALLRYLARWTAALEAERNALQERIGEVRKAQEEAETETWAAEKALTASALAEPGDR